MQESYPQRSAARPKKQKKASQPLEPSQSSKVRISVRWLADCSTAEDKEAKTQRILASRPTLEDLANILKSLRDESVRSMGDYTSAAWPYMVADRMGYQRAIDEVLKIIDLKEKVTP